MSLASRSAGTVTPYSRAMPKSVSPLLTVCCDGRGVSLVDARRVLPSARSVARGFVSLDEPRERVAAESRLALLRLLDAEESRLAAVRVLDADESRDVEAVRRVEVESRRV
jgi:hypothetical protein